MSAPLPRFWFGAPPELAEGEAWVAHHASNRTQGLRAVGGGLHFTTQRALFCPNVMDRNLGGQAWAAPLAEIAAVGVEPGRLSPFELFSGGIRSRLRLDMRDGEVELFVVSDPERIAADLRQMLSR